MSDFDHQKEKGKNEEWGKNTYEIAKQLGGTLLTGVLLGLGGAAGGNLYNRLSEGSKAAKVH